MDRLFGWWESSWKFGLWWWMQRLKTVRQYKY